MIEIEYDMSGINYIGIKEWIQVYKYCYLPQIRLILELQFTVMKETLKGVPTQSINGKEH